jgi:hypothetical protein
VLAKVSTSELTDVDRARLVFLRATNRLWALADPAGAKVLVDDALRTTQPRARSFLDAFLTVYWAAMGKPEAARESAKNVGRDELPDVVARTMAWALTVAAGDTGRTTEAVAAAVAGYPTPMRGFLTIADAHVGALLLSGRIADAQHVVEMLRHYAADYPSPQLAPIIPLVSGRAAVGAGRLDTACDVLGPAVEVLTTPAETLGLQYRCQLPRTIALAMRGLTDEAATALAALEDRRHPHWRYLDYERGIAKAWVAAAQGAVTEAIRVLLSAAETARANGQFAAEVMCLQTVSQFGDGSGAPRLRELGSDRGRASGGPCWTLRRRPV